MEIWALSISSTDGFTHLLAWKEERFPLRLFGPAAAILALAGSVGSPFAASSTVHRAVLALVALLGSRLWDDLMDRRLDAVNHPQRILPRVDPKPFAWVAVLSLAIAFFLSLALSLASALLFAFLCAGLSAFYRWRPSVAVLLLKYPLLVLVLRARLDLTGACAMAVVYGAMLLDERAAGRAHAGTLRVLVMGFSVMLLLSLGWATT